MRSGDGSAPARRRLRPYRDSAIVYGVLAVLVVVIASVTGGRVVWAVVLAIVAFCAAMAWTWWNLRRRAR